MGSRRLRKNLRSLATTSVVALTLAAPAVSAAATSHRSNAPEAHLAAALAHAADRDDPGLSNAQIKQLIWAVNQSTKAVKRLGHVTKEITLALHTARAAS